MRTLTPTLRGAGAATLAAVALGLGACGSSDSGKDDEAAFKTGYQKQSAALKAIGDDIGTAISTAREKTDAAIVTEFSGLATRTHDAVDGLEALTPPDAAKADLTALSRTLDKVAGDLDTIVTTVKAKDLDSVKKASSALVVDAAPVKAVRARLDKLAAGL